MIHLIAQNTGHSVRRIWGSRPAVGSSRKRIFGECMRARASTTRRFGGTGLGLVLSRRFAQMLGGDVSVTSEHGKGSTFSLRIAALGEQAGC